MELLRYNLSMTPALAVASSEARSLVDFVNFALNCGERSDICKILQKIAVALKCYGAIVWELDPETPLESEDARLFTAGHWFRSNKRFAAHNLLVSKSLVGKAMRSGVVERSNSLGEPCTARSSMARAFYEDHEMRCCLVAPTQTEDGVHSALALYRQESDGPFYEPDERVKAFSELLPGLQQSLHHKVSFRLIDEVKDILQEPEHRPATEVLEKACRTIQNNLGIVEASIFVEDREAKPGSFALAATGFPAFTRTTSYAPKQAGLTSWVITNGMPLAVWDLRDWVNGPDRVAVEAKFKGLIWRDPSWAWEIAAKTLAIPIGQLPPIAFLALPLQSDGNTFGVLRISLVANPPYYFTTRERSLLSVIASQIAQYWTRRLDRQLVIDENTAWTALVKALEQLNYSVNAELKKSSPSVMNVLRKGLETTANLIPGGEIADIRLIDEKAKELYFALTYGPGWDDTRKNVRFQLKGKPSYGAEVLDKGTSKIVSEQNRTLAYQRVFPEAKYLLIVPIRSQDTSYGVLDIRSLSNKPFPTHSVQLAELLGQQLGLYHALVDNFAELRSTQKELKKTTKETVDAFADWQHQIRGPVNQAFLRIQDILRYDYNGVFSDAPQFVRVQRGLLAKAHRATRSLKLFQDLAAAKPLRLSPILIRQDDLVKRVIEACLDNRILASYRRKVDFKVDEESFQPLGSRGLKMDGDLLDQALNNVIDNAFKYSYKNTEIRIQGSFTAGLFRLTISNEGIPLHESETEKVAMKYWRAENAEAVVGEGNGIGLWVVKHIMEAHGGRLNVSPTIEARTSVHLIFPWS